MLHKGNKVAIVACSNGQLKENKVKVDMLLDTLRQIGLIPVCSEYLYANNSVFNGTAKEKAEALLKFYSDKDIKAIFDISGGDLANEVIGYLDFEVIRKNPKVFFGYSDLTTVINAIYAITGNKSYLYQVRNLIYDHKEAQINNFISTIIDETNKLLDIDYKFIQGDSMEGVVVGGNIRCLLKLAGTPYFPEVKDKILLLESCGGEAALMTSFINQLKFMGVFKKVKGILLGTFTKMEQSNIKPTIEEIIIDVIDDCTLPIAKTKDIGHGTDSKAIVIGEKIILDKK